MALFYEQGRQKILSGWTNVKFIVIKFLSVRELGTFRNASMLAYLSNCYNNYDFFKSALVASKLTLYAKFPFWKGEIDGTWLTLSKYQHTRTRSCLMLFGIPKQLW